MENKFIRADDVAQELSVSKPYAYKLIRKLNEELKAQKFITIAGRVNCQYIETVNGSASQQNSGVINTYNTTNDTSSMITLIDKLLASLPKIQGVDSEEIENVKNNSEMIQKQLKSDAPKKNCIGKALAGIKKFVGDFSIKLAVTLMTNGEKALKSKTYRRLPRYEKII